LARACSGAGKNAEAEDLFDDAEKRLAALGLRNELVTLDAARAEAALRAGDAERALRMVESTAERARELGSGEATQWLDRLRAGALLALGSTAEAAAAVDHGLAAGAAADGGYERAMLLLAGARVAERRGEDARQLQDEAACVLTSLGVVALGVVA